MVVVVDIDSVARLDCSAQMDFNGGIATAPMDLNVIVVFHGWEGNVVGS